MADTGAAIADAGAAMAATGAAPAPAAPAGKVARGASIGRYLVLERVGGGGMGIVYLAYDPELDRKVALKLLRTGGNDPDRRARLLREAQAMARLAHPNVIAVHDVGTVGDEVFVAMEYVDGQTLGAWLTTAPQSWRERIAPFLDAGRGLAAAHAAGIVHRDFKPDNVLIGKDGRVRVLDFGLARGAELRSAAEVEKIAGTSGGILTTPITQTGSVMGTPAYMAPEQFAGADTDERTDQFSYCVSVYEALYGRRPFKGATFEELRSAVADGDIETASDRRVPAPIRAAVLRGLAPDPAARHPSLTSLLAALSYDPARVWRRVAVAVGAACVIAALVIAGALMWRSAQARHRAEQQVEIAQRFGQQVARLEAFMRQAYSAPLHDIRPERAHVLQQMTAIEKEAGELGDVASGPAEYALGRGYLSLHDYAKARTHLEAALHFGYQAAEVRYALGLTLAGLYQQGIAEIERIRDSSARAARFEALRKTLRDPALEYLRAVKDSVPEASAHVEGLIALYEGNYAAALDKAAAALAAAPWMYESHQLAGDTLVARAFQSNMHGAYPEAVADLERAGDEYRRALAAAPSDASLLAADCQRHERQVVVAVASRQLDHALVDAAIEPCERARQADPDDVAPVAAEAFSLVRAADFFAEYRGERPDDLTARAMPLIDALHALEPRSKRADYDRAILFTALTQFQSDHREDCERSADEVIASLHRVIEIDPTDPDAYGDLIFQFQNRANRQREAGGDPRPLLATAIETGERGMAMAPDTNNLGAGLANVWSARADYEASHSLNPEASLGHAIELYKRALAVNTNDASALNNMGLALQSRSYYRLQHGDIAGEDDLEQANQAYQRVLALGVDSKALGNLGFLAVDRSSYLTDVGRDPRPAITEGIGYIERAFAANPSERYVFFNTASLRLTEAEYLVEIGQDPTAAITAADAAIDADLRRSKEPDPDILAYRSLTFVLAARWAMATKKSPASAFAAADAAMAQAEKLDATTDYVLDSRFRLERWRAEWLVAEGRDATAAIARARAALVTMLKNSPDSPSLKKISGEIAVVEARSLRDAQGDSARRREEAVATARRELQAALAANRFLEHGIAPLLAEIGPE